MNVRAFRILLAMGIAVSLLTLLIHWHGNRSFDLLPASSNTAYEQHAKAVKEMTQLRAQTLDSKVTTVRTNKRRLPPPIKTDTVVVTILESGDAVNDLENMVGNIHGIAPHATILVYGLRTSHRDALRIQMWRRVTFIPIEDRFLLSQHTSSKLFQHPLVHSASTLHQRGHITDNRLFSDVTVSLLEHSNAASRWLPMVIDDALQSMEHGRLLFLRPTKVIPDADAFSYLESIIDSERPLMVVDYRHHMLMSVMGFRAPATECLAYRQIIEPMLKCLRSLCRTQPPYIFCEDDHICRTKEPLPIEFSNIEAYKSSTLQITDIKDPMLAKEQREWFCRIQFREEGFHSLAKLTLLPTHDEHNSELEIHLDAQRFIEPREGEISIALGVPSRGVTNMGKLIPLAKLPLLDPFLTSFLQTYPVPDSTVKWKFAIMIAFDEGDPTYESASFRQELQQLMKKRIGNRPIEVHFFRFRNMRGSVTYLWNGLFEYAVDAGFDYFYQVNDDLSFGSKSWPLFFRNALMSNPLCPNLGVVGPKDEKNPQLMTQSMTHRTHFDIFGSYYPSSLRNWYSDDWMMQVYAGTKPSSTVSLDSVTISNTQKSGTRYQVCSWNLNLLDGELKKGRERIANWLSKNQEYCANLTTTVKERFPEVFRNPLRNNPLRSLANGQFQR